MSAHGVRFYIDDYGKIRQRPEDEIRKMQEDLELLKAEKENLLITKALILFTESPSQNLY